MHGKGDFESYDYWNERYTTRGGNFEWYHNYEVLRDFLRAVIPLDSNILQVGVGSSLIQLEMIRDGYQKITNVDYSDIVIKQLKEQHKDIKQLTYMTVDCRDLSCFKNGTFDCVLDKGTLDAIVCEEDFEVTTPLVLHEIFRVLKDSGSYVLISHGDPASRLDYLCSSELNWEVSCYWIRTDDSGVYKGPFSTTDKASTISYSFIEDDDVGSNEGVVLP